MNAVTTSGESEIRLVGLRKRLDLVAEIAGIVLGASFLRERRRNALPALARRPRRVERTGVLDREIDLERLAAVEELEALYHMQLRGVRRAVGIDKRLVVHADRVDHERVAALVMADRFAVPGRLEACTVGPVQIDAAHAVVGLLNDPDLLRLLHEIEPPRIEQHRGNA